MTKRIRRPVWQAVVLLSVLPACGKWAEEEKVPDVAKPPVAETPKAETPPAAVTPRTETPAPPVAILPAAPLRPAPSIELARKAVAAIRAAGLNPAGEVKTAHTARPKISEKASEAIRKAGLDMGAVQDGLKAYPQTLSETPEQIAEAARRAAEQQKEYERLVKEGLLEKLPKDPQQGFGADTTGGEGGEVVAITEPTQAAVEAAFAKAARSGKCRIEFRCAGDIDIGRPLPILRSPNVTVDGQGVATLWGSAIPPNRAVISVSTNDVILRNLRIRHGGDNVSLGGEAYAGSSRVVLSHVSSSASRDDGISAGWGARDVTIQWCLLAGNTRSIFIKYKGSTNVSVHHNLIEKQMIRGPLVSGKAFVDFRNNVVRNWLGWGSRFEDGGYGNAVNNLHVMSPFARKTRLKP
ncbi:MAG: right-handed parallel beta-helix repeat-containing protein, partial [Planctomycetota bacterium]